MFQVATHAAQYNAHAHHQGYNYPIAPAAPPVQLPRTLTRPNFTEVSRDAILAVAPELNDVPPEYIRRGLYAKSPQMLAGISSCAPSHLPSSMPKSHLPASLTVPVCPSSSTPPSFPTHVLALSSSKPTSSNETLPLFPVHSLVLASHCALLPKLPAAHPSSASSSSHSIVLPILPLSLPSPSAFPLLHNFMYTHRLDTLLNALIPMPPSFLSGINHAGVKAALGSGPRLHQLSQHLCGASGSGLQQLTNHAAHITALWRNVAALGLYDPELWDAMDLAWEVVLGALNLAAAGH
jgi:hypothetical protein